jgi:hypothetical protein
LTLTEIEMAPFARMISAVPISVPLAVAINAEPITAGADPISPLSFEEQAQSAVGKVASASIIERKASVSSKNKKGRISPALFYQFT